MINRYTFILSLMLITFLVVPVQAGESIKLAVGEWPPYFSEEFKYGGFGAKVCTEAFALAGIEATYEQMPWKRAYENTRLGKYAASPGWRRTTERKQLFYFSAPIFPTRSVFFHRKSIPFEWSKLEDLKDKKIGITLGYSYIPKLQPIVDMGHGRLDIAPTDEINMLKLAAGRIDVFPCSQAVGYYILRTKILPGAADFVTNHPKAVEEGSVYLMVSKKIENGRMIIAKFNEGLNKLKTSGRYDQLLIESLRGDYIPKAYLQQ